MKRSTILCLLRVAGYHSDMRKFVRTYVEERVSYAVAKAEYRKGEAMKTAGVKCDCFFCKRENGVA